MQDIKNIVATEFEAVNDTIIEQLHSHIPQIENIGHYIVGAGGKRLRPLLVLLAGGACGNIAREHVNLAALIEFIHTATLLHDDVVDVSTFRRGQETANAKWGSASSILVGDFLYTRAFQMLVEIANMELMAILSNTTNAIAEGEVLQLVKSGDPTTSEKEYFQVIENKTAVLFAAAAQGGAVLSTQGPDNADALYQYGLELGIAFQMIDDVLDYQGDPETMGKNIGSDLADGKPTLPLIYTLRNTSAASVKLIENAIRERKTENLTTIIDAVKSCGALEFTRQHAIQHSAAALEHLSPLPASKYKDALSRLTELAVNRDR